MWFKFPDGVDQISVQQQPFKVEVEQEGKKFFRAPDHFAPLILDLPGFTGERPQGDGVPPDLPPSIPGAESTVDALTLQLSELKESEAALRETLATVTKERDKAVGALATALERITELTKGPEPKNGAVMDEDKAAPKK